ncbi:hypothetical protein POM88_047235 [Heracleum sosnowskyi]|uniref:Late embryogenesis abundant protein LEA-2 subgroup domain-containing protein n=1 Tax=Heracleum sosnowskyi TaxID=360622 RepID=A0AAD8GT36_9APIA|nr:hypothetical protein POM88_047235 [Heracleum sosnowskyi]
MTKVHPINPNTPVAVAVVDARETPPSHRCFLKLAVPFSSFIVLVCLVVLPMVLKQSVRRYNRSHITTIPTLKIDSLIATNFTLSFHPNQISADWNLKMNLETDNSHLSFSNMTVSIFYDVLQAGVTDVIPFDVVPLNSTTHFDVRFSGSSGLIYDSMINDISGRMAAESTLTVHVSIETSVKKSYKGRWTDELQLKMDCEDISLYFGHSDKSRAQMLNPPNVCKDARYS